MSHDNLVLSLPGGVKIAVPPFLSCMTTYVLLEQEDWFEPEIRFLRRALRPGMNIIDIGANFGVYSLSLAPSIGPTGRIIAIEPASRTMEYLRHSVTINQFSQITPLMAAVSDHVGQGFLRFGNSEELHALSAGAGTAQEGETVPLVTLDSLMARENLPSLDFLKIDGEGHEAEILAGAQQVLDRYDPMILLEVLGPDSAINLALVDDFRARGYQIFRVMAGLDVLVPVDNQTIEENRFINVFALKPSAVAKWTALGMVVPHVNAPESWASPAVRDNLLRDYWAGLTWASPLVAGWSDWLAGLSPDDPDYFFADALALWVMAQNPGQPKALRAGCLLVAIDILHHLNRVRPDANWLMVLTHIQGETGNRRGTFHAVNALEEIWPTQQGDFIRRPFLALLPHPGPDIAWPLWMDVALHHVLDQTEAWSSFFRKDRSVTLNHRITAHPWHPVAAQRRLLLSRALQDKKLPPEWTKYPRLTDGPHADVWAGRVSITI